ncbi:MAG TPA: GntR family transcriptional regulator [Fimbriimonadaceae bacterium]|nr:GntR family transcriptional regulator [Fimbriimonadaceae bacterium]
MVHAERSRTLDLPGVGSPLASSVAERITELIHSGEFAHGQGLPSERELSSRFGVSRGVVRLALKQLAASGVIESKANCRPVIRKTRRPTKTDRKQICIWLWPNTADFAASSIMKGIHRAGLEEDIRLVVGHAQGGNWDSIYEAESRFLHNLADDPEHSGAIIWHLGHERNLGPLRTLRARGVSLVFIDRLPPAGFEADYVGTNNEAAAEAAVQHLVSLGHKRIALITNIDGCSSVREREAGYRRALKDAGIPYDGELVLRDSIDEPEGVQQLIGAALALKAPPSAVFCINDHMALQARDALTQRGLSIPGDISLVGFDGTLRWVPQGGHLTTLNQDFQRIGQLAADLVIERMTMGPPAAYRHLLLDAPLIDNGSTATAHRSSSNGGCVP